MFLKPNTEMYRPKRTSWTARSPHGWPDRACRGACKCRAVTCARSTVPMAREPSSDDVGVDRVTIELYGLRTAVHLRMRAHAALRQARHRELGHRRRRDRIHAALDAVDDRRRLLAGLLGRGVAVPADGHTLQTVRSARLDDVSLPPRAMDPHRKPGRSRSQTTASLLSSRRLCSVSNMRRKYVINLHTTVLEPGLVQADSCLRRKRFLVAMREIMIAISVHYCTTTYPTALVIYATNFTRSASRPDVRSARSGPKA